MTTKDGGPVFPQTIREHKQGVFGVVARQEAGITLRDYFAGQALAGLCANPGGPFQANAANGWSIVNCTDGDIARTCFSLADALLAARQKDEFEGGANARSE